MEKSENYEKFREKHFSRSQGVSFVKNLKDINQDLSCGAFVATTINMHLRHFGWLRYIEGRDHSTGLFTAWSFKNH